MKKRIVFFILLVFIGLTACSPEKTKPLSYQGFLDHIWDFEVNTDTFVYKASNTVIVDFYAKWCGPCRQLLPIMEKMAEEYEGELTVYKVDVDQEKKLANYFLIKGLPVFFIFSTDGHFKRYTGLPTEAELRKLIEEQIK